MGIARVVLFVKKKHSRFQFHPTNHSFCFLSKASFFTFGVNKQRRLVVVCSLRQTKLPTMAKSSSSSLSKPTTEDANTTTTTAGHIKGYLPVRVRFHASPTVADKDDDNKEHETFFYVREHQPHPSKPPLHKKKKNNSNSHDKETDPAASPQQHSPTLFIANAPSFPPIDTPTMLKALLGRFGAITRVTVVPNPRQEGSDQRHFPSYDDATSSCYFDTIVTDRFAHVVFATRKDLRSCYKALQRIMSSCHSNNNDKTTTTPPALTMEHVERQTLADAVVEQQRRRRKQQQQESSHDINDEDNDDEMDIKRDNVSGFQKVYQTFRAQCRHNQDRTRLLDECNAVMEAYEEAEQARLRAISSEPDDDGFITVTHSTQPVIGNDDDDDNNLEEGRRNGAGRPKRHAAKGRSRKRKKGPGAHALDDFYRFQTKAKRKEDIQDLRQRFQEDLQRIQKLKESNNHNKGGAFQPFG